MRTVIIIIGVLVYTLAAVLTARVMYRNGLPSARAEKKVTSWKITVAIASCIFPITYIAAAIYIVSYWKYKRKES